MELGLKSPNQRWNDGGPVMNGVGLDRYVQVVWAVVLTSVALYLARSVFEPIAFALFCMALVWPFQRAVESRMPKPIALILSVFLTLFVIVVPVSAIAWSIADIVHWIFANVERLQSMYTRTSQWLEEYNIFVSEGLGRYDVRTFIGFLQEIAMGVNYFSGFFVVVLLLLMFGLLELSEFRNRLAELEPKVGWNVSQTAGEIARRIRKYMLVRTIASVLTGLAVFAFTLSMGLELAVAWGVISFVCIVCDRPIRILAGGDNHLRRSVHNSSSDRQLS
jgi:predicted PurR-regulated permease PerM